MLINMKYPELSLWLSYVVNFYKCALCPWKKSLCPMITEHGVALGGAPQRG